MKKKSIILIIILCLIIGITIAIIIKNYRLKCPSGYKLSDNLCTKIETVDAFATKYCIDGYQLENNTCTKVETIPPTIKYYCDNTYKSSNNIIVSASTLVGSICTYTMSHEPAKKRTCLPGALPYNDTKCRLTIIVDAASRIDIRTGQIMYYCIGDQELHGTKCYIYGYSDYVYENICVEGFSLIEGKCVKSFTYNAGWEANCPNGYTYIDKNTCTRKIATDIQYNYECPNGYTTNKNGVPGLEVPQLDVPGVSKKCYKKITIPAYK